MLGLHSRHKCIAGHGEGDLDTVTDGLVEDSAMALDRATQDVEMVFDSLCHRLPVSLPALGRALDVGEEKGDGPRWELGHDPLQSLGCTWCCPIVAREEIDPRWQAVLV